MLVHGKLVEWHPVTGMSTLGIAQERIDWVFEVAAPRGTGRTIYRTPAADSRDHELAALAQALAVTLACPPAFDDWIGKEADLSVVELAPDQWRVVSVQRP